MPAARPPAPRCDEPVGVPHGVAIGSIRSGVREPHVVSQ